MTAASPVPVHPRLGVRAAFGCRMCGQCALPVTGYVCPMSCPKERWGLNYWQGRDEQLRTNDNGVNP